MRVLAFGSYDVRSHPRVAVLIEGLTAHGAEVREVNVPLGLDTAARVGMLRHPWRVPKLGLRLAKVWTTLTRRARSLRRSGWLPDVVLVGYLGHFGVLLARRLFPGTPIVLDHLIFAADTAADRGVSAGMAGRTIQALLRRLDAAALAAADVIVLDTDEHAALLADPGTAAAPEAAERAVVVPVGAPQRWFAAGELAAQPAQDAQAGHDSPAVAAPAGLSVVFFGLFTPLQGAPVIGEALGLLTAGDAVTVTMIGTGQDLAATRSAAGVNADASWIAWRDWVEPEDLPHLVAGHDVCLGIFSTTAKGLRVVPNKVFQAAAAGCVVLTGDTAPQRRALGDAAVFVTPGDGAALADALRLLATDRPRLQQLRRAGRELAVRQFSPVAVTDPLWQRLQQWTSLAGGSPRSSPGPRLDPTIVPNPGPTEGPS